MASQLEIQQTLQIFHQPGDVIEVRVLDIPGRGRPHTASGYFDDVAVAAECAAKYELRKPFGIYFVLNQCDPQLFARSPNLMTDYPKVTTSDHDIIRRRWLLIDVDPIRPAGIGSTDEQCEAARGLAESVDGWLQAEMLWSDPVIADSGNGCHLLYPIDMPNDSESEALVASILNALQSSFGDDDCSIDQKVFNAARISKLYSTTVRKGHATADRPHRKSHLIHVPDYLQPKDEAVPCTV